MGVFSGLQAKAEGGVRGVYNFLGSQASATARRIGIPNIGMQKTLAANLPVREGLGLAAHGAFNTLRYMVEQGFINEHGTLADAATIQERLAYIPEATLSDAEINAFNFGKYTPEPEQARLSIKEANLIMEYMQEAVDMYKKTGEIKSFFREYDIRGLIDKGMSPRFMYYLARAQGTLLRQIGIDQCVVGHDLRTYHPAFAKSAIEGLRDSGVTVHFIGLCSTPMAYFSQFLLGRMGLFMITASHNPNGWSGAKLGFGLAETLGPVGCARIRDIFASGKFVSVTKSGRGRLIVYDNEQIKDQYINDVIRGFNLSGMKIVVDTGCGVGGPIVAEAFRRAGAEVIALNDQLDDSYPAGNPNPELADMKDRVQAAVKKHNAHIGFAFDGDVDRLGAAGKNTVAEADQIATLLARQVLKNASGDAAKTVIVDLKASLLVKNDLEPRGARVVYWITGHSYIKSLKRYIGALFAAEKSGHIFPDRGYDEALRSALYVAQYLKDENMKIEEALGTLPKYTMGPSTKIYMAEQHVPQNKTAKDRKYEIVVELQNILTGMVGEKIILEDKEYIIKEVDTLNGARVFLKTSEEKEGPNFLLRASSNEEVLTLNIETPGEEDRARLNIIMAIQAFVRDKILSNFNEFGPDAKWKNTLDEDMIKKRLGLA